MTGRPDRPQRRRRPPVAITSLAAIAVVPAILMAAVWQYADANVVPPTTTTTTTVPPAPVGALGTDLLSLRRHPTPLAERVAVAQADAAFAERLTTLDGMIDGQSCLQIVADGEVVADAGTDGPVIPASNEKLFVAATALQVLGGDHRFRTELVSTRPFNGVVTGDVYLVGGGDPVLRTADVVDPLPYPAFNTTSLEALADQLVTLGITEIQGDVVGDGSRYDDEFRAPSWGDEITNFDAGPYDALLVNDGVIQGEYGLNPSRSAARTFIGLLQARGVVVAGAAANADRPADGAFTTLALIESRPLTDVLVELLHTSDNNTAEMLVKEIGFAATGIGSRDAGLGVIRQTLGEWGIPLDGVDLQDGSGLSGANRTTCTALASLLAATPVADELRDLLPVAGRDGTLATQLIGTVAEARLRAKTGTLTGVKALTGTQPGADGRDVDFALVLNGEGVDEPARYQPVWEQVVSLIDEYPIVVEPDVPAFAPNP